METETVSRTLSVLLVDDHALMRIGLANVIATDPGMSICGEASNGAQALELYRSLRPDITLMDLRLPDTSGAKMTETIRGEFPEAKIIVISSFAPDEEVYAAVQAGARAYLLKTIEADHLIDVIRKVAAGQRHIPPEIAKRLAARIPRSELTERERGVLALVVRGRRNREIADELGITEGTVKTHVANILNKLGVTDRTEAATAAIERGIVKLS
jgi:DNA-binding NarL/FixJ family response regulator